MRWASFLCMTVSACSNLILCSLYYFSVFTCSKFKCPILRGGGLKTTLGLHKGTLCT